MSLRIATLISLTHDSQDWHETNVKLPAKTLLCGMVDNMRVAFNDAGGMVDIPGLGGRGVCAGGDLCGRARLEVVLLVD